MFFSVIIPTHNRCAFLEEAVQSVLDQTFTDFELIIIDDASTDNTVAYLETLKNEKITVRVNSENKGVSYSRNRGIEIAKGTYLTFLDSDDLWEPNKLEEQRLFFASNPGLFVCHTEERWLRNGKHMNQSKHHKKQGGFFFDRAVEMCLVSPSTVAIHRKLFSEKGFFDESLEVCEDYDLWLRLNMTYPFGFIDRPLITKRGGHEDQLSQKLPAMDRFRIISMMNLLEREILTDKQKEIIVNAIRKKRDILLKGAEKHGNRGLVHFCNEIEAKINRMIF